MSVFIRKRSFPSTLPSRGARYGRPRSPLRRTASGAPRAGLSLFFGEAPTLAGHLLTTPQWISKVERNEATPTLDQLWAGYLMRVGERQLSEQDPFCRWLFVWMEARADLDAVQEGTRLAITDELGRVLDRLKASSLEPAARPLFSLQNFPFAGPISIVLGDRREPNPETRGDLFAYSGSVLDMYWLMDLNLAGRDDVEVVSDKVFVVASDDYLRRRFADRHLLVIGSPAVNMAARYLVNPGSIFRFIFPEHLQVFRTDLRRISPRLASKANLRVFWHIARNDGKIDRQALVREGLLLREKEQKKRDKEKLTIEQVEEIRELVVGLLKDQAPSWWMNEFRSIGLIDPVTGKVHGTSTQPHNDFAVVSVARHPFAHGYKTTGPVAVLVGGIHGPGTARAVKWLADPTNFIEHPFGGVLELEEIRSEDPWAERIAEATVQCKTVSYGPRSLLEALQTARTRPESTRRLALPGMTDQDLDECIRFVETLVEL